MNSPRRVIYGPVAKSVFIDGVGSAVHGIDQSLLLSRLLLFDEVIIRSMRLREVPFLLRSFGVDGLQQLLSEGILKLSLDTVSVTTDLHIDGVRTLPELQFSQGFTDVADRTKLMTDELDFLRFRRDISAGQQSALRDLLLKRVLTPRPNYGMDVISQIQTDLSKNPQLVIAVLKKLHPGRFGDEVNPLHVQLAEVSSGVQKINTNMKKLLGISIAEEHSILENAVLTISAFNQQLADMQQYGAVTTFDESDAALIFGKIAGVLAPYNPQFRENAFLRMLEFTDIPTLLQSGRIEVGKLIKIRNSPECRELQHWLTSVHELDDKKLQSLLKGFRTQASSFISSPAGKTIRLVANAALGFIPGYGTATSLIEGAVDTFLIDKLLPTSGVLSLLNRTIPRAIG